MSRSNCEASSRNKLFSSIWMLKFPRLETIYLESCYSLEVIFDMQEYSKSSNTHMFPQLRDITIYGLPKLKYVWGNVLPGLIQNNDIDSREAPSSSYSSHHDPGLTSNTALVVEGFHNLASLTISCCNSLRQVFSIAIIRAIRNLEKLEVRDCELMENIVDNDDEEGKMESMFDRLESLILSGLPNISSICSNNCMLTLKSIRELRIENCPKLNMSSLPIQEYEYVPFTCTRENKSERGHMPNLENIYLSNCILKNPLVLHDGDRLQFHPIIDQYYFTKLTSLTIGTCHNIKFLLSASPSKTQVLTFLEKLQVYSCNGMKEIVSHDSEGVEFPRLQHLVLRHLSNLVAFSQSTNTFDFPLLRKVKIECCPNMQEFSNSSPTTKLVDCEMIGPHCSFSNYISMGDLNSTLQGFKAFESEILSHSILDNNDMLQHVRFDELTSITIDGCNNLKTLLSHSMPRSLEQLQQLSITNCEMMENIITMEVGNEVETLFPKLEVLYLYNLVKLECVCSSYSGYHNPSEKVDISLPSSSSLKDGTQTVSFPDANVTVKAPCLHEVLSSMGFMGLTQSFLEGRRVIEKGLNWRAGSRRNITIFGDPCGFLLLPSFDVAPLSLSGH